MPERHLGICTGAHLLLDVQRREGGNDAEEGGARRTRFQAHPRLWKCRFFYFTNYLHPRRPILVSNDLTMRTGLNGRRGDRARESSY